MFVYSFHFCVTLNIDIFLSFYPSSVHVLFCFHSRNMIYLIRLSIKKKKNYLISHNTNNVLENQGIDRQFLDNKNSYGRTLIYDDIRRNIPFKVFRNSVILFFCFKKLSIRSSGELEKEIIGFSKIPCVCLMCAYHTYILTSVFVHGLLQRGMLTLEMVMNASMDQFLVYPIRNFELK